MNRAEPGLIRTPDQRLRIFVSSTLRELAPERRAARSTIERLALAPVMFELGARPHPPRSLYRAYLEQSDVFIGMYWESYGWVAPGEDVSGLEDEYNLAPDIPMLIYIKDSAQRDPRLEALLDRIRDDDRVSYVSFGAATELRRLLTSDLATLLAERFASGSTRGGPVLEPSPPPGATTVVRPPSPLARMIGRDHELALASRMLTDENHRLITITGPGGVGKTRLATAISREVEPAFPDGVAFVDLAPVHDPGLVIDAIASAVGIRDDGETPLTDKLEAALQGARMLLVLDNVEQVVEAAPELARLLSRTHISILATSRILLRVDGEQSLALHGLSSGSAISLFAERARSVKPDFELSETNQADVATICEAVDSLPLAVELAAARIRVLTPAEIATRLHRSLPLLVDGGRDRPERQRTLRATIDWSAQLLRPAERILLRRLGVFRSGFAMDAVEWINDDLAGGDTLETLSALVDGSLIQQHDRGPRTWFTMLATVREYAREHLSLTGELARCEQRHATFYVRLAAAAGAELIGPRQGAWLSRLSDEGTELRAAVETLLASRRWDDAVDLVWSLDWFWGIAGRLIEVGTWMQRVLDEGVEASERSRKIAMLEVVAVNTWRKPEQAAIEPLTECADFSHAEGDRLTEAKALIGIGMLHLLNAPPDFEAAEEALQKAFDLAESLADPYCTAMVGMVIGWTHTLRGDLPKAIETLDACMADGQSIGDGLILGSLHSARGWAALLAGDTDRAEEDFREHLLIASTIGHEPGVGYALEGLFATASTRGDVEHAGHLLGAAEAIRQRKGNTAAAAVASFHGHWVRKIERSPHAAQFEQARNGGRGLDPAAAVELALHEGDPVMSRGDG